MFTNWRRFTLLCFLLILTLSVGCVMRGSVKPEPPVSTTTTTTKEFVWNEQTINQAIEIVADEEGFEDVYLLKQLAYHESRYLEHDKILDTNGYYSYGLLHFQLYTFLEQAKLYKVIPEDTDLEQGRILIMNPELQLRTICRMDRKTIRQKWYHSWNKIYDL